MKKNIDWLKENVQKRIDKLPRTYNGLYIDGSRDAYLLALKDINQLDEPEVLSEGWLSANVVVGQYPEGMGYIVPAHKLQNLLVPKQELAVVPQEVADWYENHKDNLEKQLQGIAYNLDKHGTMPVLNKVDDWINKTEKPLQTLASLSFGYEVKEEEQKFYVLNENKQLMLKKNEGEVKSAYNSLRGVGENYLTFYQLTEQEIKDYDPRYWAFRKPVEEMEE